MLKPKLFTTLLSATAVVFPAVLMQAKSATAQPIAPANDGTVTVVNPEGQTYNIDSGSLSEDGANLFHSFEKFGLDAGQAANFLSNPQIQNILGRIGGGDPSIINGLIEVTGGNSNLYLMNPSGFVFGNNASLNVPAAFSAVTADGIGFDGGWFNAIGNNDYSELVGTPNQFAFTMSNPGSIINAGNLGVNPGENLTLMGGSVINTGNLSTPGGSITLAAVPGESLVRVSQAGMVLSLDIESSRIRGNSQQPANQRISPLSVPKLLAGGGEVGNATNVVVNSDGSVRLTGSGINFPSATGTAIASGTIDAARDNIGGNVTVIGDRVGVVDANIDASGMFGGGQVFLGGD